MKFSVDRELRRAETCERKGDRDEARAIYQAIVERFPSNLRAKAALSALNGSGEKPAALSEADIKAVLSLYRTGQFAQAADLASTLLDRAPGLAVLWTILGGASHRLGRLEAAERAFRKAVEIDPASADAQYNLGKALVALGALEGGIECFEKALAIRPDLAPARGNLGQALNDFGNALRGEGRFSEAAARYRQALEIDQRLAEVHNNLGAVLAAQGRIAEAIASYDRALAIDPGLASAHNNRGNALIDQGRLDEAVASFRRVLDIRPGHTPALAQMLHQQAHMCDWDELNSVHMAIGLEGAAVSPFIMLARDDDPARQLLRARNYAAQTFRQQPLPLPAAPAERPERLRIGYFSGHFHDHATLHLASGLLREHDKKRFEIYAYSYGPANDDAVRSRAAADVDHFIDIAGLSDRAIADLARSHGIDIAIDLMGYTRQTRSRLFAFRLAPVQINYLVYPGTMGADFIDYIIADRSVIPPADQPFYSEKVIYLPHSYQPNDDLRQIVPPQTVRADFGLPQDGLVFCCFNNSYKITPREFDIWMRVLARTPGSVLWLLRANRWCEANLRGEAGKRGIDPGRLVFADRLPPGDHLARHAHADLFLDTFNYNAHTTASDALWAGLPLVTRRGRQFAARVAASLLEAVGLPELITDSEADYEALILDLAGDRQRLAAVKDRLAVNRLAQPLFDTARYARHFEQALDETFAAHIHAR